MPVDQPENPRIRTKVNILDARIDEEYYQLTERLRGGRISVEKFQNRTLEFLQDLGLAGTFTADIETVRGANVNGNVARRERERERGAART